MTYGPTLAIIVFLFFGAGWIGYAIGKHVGSMATLSEWEDTQNKVRDRMRSLGFCERATELRKQNACPVTP